MKTPALKFASAVLATSLLAACASTPAARIAKDQTSFDAYPAEVQEKIRAGEIAIGYTPDMVRLALGPPDRQYVREATDGTSEVWAYQDNAPTFGFGFGFGSYGSSVGGGVGVNTGGSVVEEKLRVVFLKGAVSSIERTQ